MPKLCLRTELDPAMCAHCRAGEVPDATVVAGALWGQVLRDIGPVRPAPRPVTIVPVPTTARLAMRRHFNPRIHQVPRSDYYSHAVAAS